ncbi:hypothetical protein [Chitinophaga sp. Cy-1792]|uniref:hypothetical protein n=1 Tax=Chitinophaga sp. Cy-1792 TaxID=2608339 RepID=UPI00141FD93D|nr:hypothetical protein [Chitinophaga sp. Cy-1792]NIG54649.1 hypothetical protein [Chitinophaga sp. Cy-1792]
MKNIILILLLICCNKTFAQTKYEKYQITGLGTILVPDLMELQDGLYRQQETDKLKAKGIEVSGDKIVFQQKGLNLGTKNAFSSYARVTITTTMGRPGEFGKLSQPPNISAQDIQVIKEAMTAKFAANRDGLKLVNWITTAPAVVNGNKCFRISYLRQLKNNPYVVVDMYEFQNNDRKYMVMMSYRRDDARTWEPVYKKMLESLQITNVK